MFKRANIFLLIVILIITTVVNGQSVRISGLLLDKNEGTPLSGVVVFLNPGNQVLTTGPSGEYRFNTYPGKKQISTRSLGYKSATLNFAVVSDTVINVYLAISPFELGEVKVTGDSVKTMEITLSGSILFTPTALKETPRLFSEPDLLKSFQLLPGIVPGKDGTADIYVRGGTAGQNIILANGCYFFIPGHLLGIISPLDLDFLESAEMFKDYFPSELGGGASSIISLDFKKPQSDSLHAQLRLGLLSSGFTVEVPLRKSNWDLTFGLKRGNYSIFAPLLKKIVDSDVGDFLPPDNYSFYDGFFRLSHQLKKWGNINYLFFGNYDNGKIENKTNSQSGDTLIKYVDGISTGWNNMVHAFQWNLPVKNKLKWKLNLNYNRLSIGRDIYTSAEKSIDNSGSFDVTKTSYSFSPTINSIASTMIVTNDNEKFSYSAGMSGRLRYFDPNTYASFNHNDALTINNFMKSASVFEPSVFVSSTILLTKKFQFDAGLRLSGGVTRDANFVVPEPRLRLVYNPKGAISPHINYVRLSQFDHSVEGSNAGLRTMLWLPVSKDFGPEISDVLSAGFQGQISNDFVWTLDGYYKKIEGMVDFKPGASLIFDTTFVDLLDRIKGRAYGLEAGIIKKTGKLTGSVSYTYSRSNQQWNSPEGVIWIPSFADRPHNFNVSLKYHYKEKTSLGLNFVYHSGTPATVYMHETSSGEFFETKNNIRYYDYHRLDISFRHIIYKRNFSIFIDADIYNVYNRKNTFYLKKTWIEEKKRYFYKNISLFPVMPSITLTINF